MTRYDLPNFTELDLDQLGDYYDTQIDFEKRKVELDLNFEEYTISQQKMDIVKSVIDNLSDYNNKALVAIQKDYQSGDTVKFYLEQHSDIIDNDDVALSKLYLKRVGFYPENESQFAVFDYTLNEDLTQYIIVVNFKEGGDIDYLTMES